jgi:hypothetical protein
MSVSVCLIRRGERRARGIATPLSLQAFELPVSSDAGPHLSPHGPVPRGMLAGPLDPAARKTFAGPRHDSHDTADAPLPATVSIARIFRAAAA